MPLTPPPNKEFRSSGDVYIHPQTKEVFDAVTSALECFDKDGLVPWSGWLAAQSTMDELPKIVKAFFTPDCGRTYNRCEHDRFEACPDCPCRACRRCTLRWLADRHIAEKTRRADEGARFHYAVDQWRKTGYWIKVDADVQPYLDAFQQWVADYDIRPDDWEASETTVVCREYGFAGTVDGLLWLYAERNDLQADMCARIGRTGGKALVMVDTKTREKDERFFIDYALQQSGYRNAETVMLPDGAEFPLPGVTECMILQLRPPSEDQQVPYTFRPVDTGPETFKQFIRVLKSHRWRREFGTAVISPRGFPFPESYKKERTARMRRANAAAKKAAAQPPCADPWCGGRPGGGCGKTPQQHLEAGMTLEAFARQNPPPNGPAGFAHPFVENKEANDGSCAKCWGVEDEPQHRPVVVPAATLAPLGRPIETIRVSAATVPDMSGAQAAWDALAGSHAGTAGGRKAARPAAKKTAAKKATPRGMTPEERVTGRRVPDDQLFSDTPDGIPF